MTPEHISHEQADEFAIGAMAPDVRTYVAFHIDSCASCAEIVRESEEAAAALLLAVPRRQPPGRLRENVLRSAGIRKAGPIGRIVQVATASAGVAAVIVAIASFTGMVSVRDQMNGLREENGRLQTQIDDALSQKVEILALTREVQEQEQLTNDLKTASRGDRDLILALSSPNASVAEVITVDPNQVAIGRLVWDAEQKKVWFIAAHLPQRPNGETYQIWVNSGGRYVSLGTFNTDVSGFARYETFVPQGLASYESAVVTIEHANGALERSGPSVFVSDLSRLRR
ncbi:MAG: anti-sigma factor [Dehalococcoidia bacterium]|nr:anti-sigma factor [Dehalococcoidia bacterium]